MILLDGKWQSTVNYVYFQDAQAYFFTILIHNNKECNAITNINAIIFSKQPIWLNT